MTYEEILELICDCNLGYPYASSDCPHKRQAWRLYDRQLRKQDPGKAIMAHSHRANPDHVCTLGCPLKGQR